MNLVGLFKQKKTMKKYILKYILPCLIGIIITTYIATNRGEFPSREDYAIVLSIAILFDLGLLSFMAMDYLNIKKDGSI